MAAQAATIAVLSASAPIAVTAPVAITDAPPTVSWGTPDASDSLIAGQPDELLAVAGDDFGVQSVELEEDAVKTPAAVRRLLNTLVQGQLEDSRVTSLVRRNFNLLARKTVERTGHGGEHYIARSRKEYWHMWAAAIGGGFLTVFTAAIKLHIVSIHRAPVMEFLLVGTNYAISFLLLQVFGLALATKQPAMTGASLANIINRNRGDSRRSEVTDFAASISRTQLAAAIGNVLAVSLGALIFNLLWLQMFHHSYVPAEQAQKIYQSLRPLASPTAIDAALTGVLLWLAGLIGGWFENFAVYHRIPASIAQHKLRQTLGDGRMQTIADWVARNIGPWSTSISPSLISGTASMAHLKSLSSICPVGRAAKSQRRFF